MRSRSRLLDKKAQRPFWGAPGLFPHLKPELRSNLVHGVDDEVSTSKNNWNAYEQRNKKDWHSKSPFVGRAAETIPSARAWCRSMMEKI
jgi:hypothetical protein